MIKILCVDDEPTILDINRRFLENDPDLKVYTAISGPKALSYLESEHFDIIIADYLMPEMDGIELLKAVRGSGNTIPYILLSGIAREEYIIDAFENGADSYVQKGIDIDFQFYELKHKIYQVIDRRKEKLEKQLTDERYRSLFSFMPDGVALTKNVSPDEETLELEIIDTNGSFERITGIKKQNLIGRSWFDLFQSTSKDWLDHYNREKKSGVIPHFESYISEISRWVEAAIIIRSVSEIIIIISDITRKKESEAIVRATEEKFRRLVEMANEGILALNSQNRIEYGNPYILKKLGFSESELVGKEIFEFLDEQESDIYRSIINQHQIAGSGLRNLIFRNKNGDSIITLFASTAVFDSDNNYSGSIAIITDITEKLSLQNALQIRDDRFFKLSEIADDIIIFFEGEKNPSIGYINPAVITILGYQPVEFYHNPDLFASIIHPDDKSSFRNAIDLNSDSDSEIIIRVTHIDGRNIWLDMRFLMIAPREGENFSLLALARDISHQKEAEELILRSKFLLTEAQRLTHIGNFEYDLASRSGTWSDETFHIFSQPPDSNPVPIEELYLMINEGDQPRIRHNIQNLLQIGGGFETTCRIRNDENPEKWIWLKCQVGQSAFGSGIRLFGVVQDITDKVETDKFKERALRQIKKNIEQMAILIDEIRNPLSAIMGYAEFENGSYGKKIIEQVQHIDKIIISLDRGWLESLKVSEFIRKHYENMYENMYEGITDPPASK